MPTITFRENTKRNDLVIRTTVILVGIAFFAIHAFVYWRYGDFDLDPFVVVTFVILAVLWLPSLFGTGRRVPRALTLDGTGLTFANKSTSRRWTWDALSAAEMYRRNPQTAPYVRIARRDEGTVMRFLRMWREPRMIVDTYDTSLNEIAAKLNEYRDRALGGVGTTAPV